MSHINPLAKEISAKIVYYGPGLSGKTTSLKYLYSVIRAERRGELVTLATEGDRTLFFDFLPISIERVQEMPVRLQLYTVPGQVFFSSTRKLVLNGADGVVFVADSQEPARESNLQSLQDLEENLQELGMDLARFPHVFQYNKRDIEKVMPVAQMNADLNRHNAPALETCAARGTGVLNALREITQGVIRDLKRRQPQARRTLVMNSVSADDTTEGGLNARLAAAADTQPASLDTQPALPPVSPPLPSPLPANAPVPTGSGAFQVPVQTPLATPAVRAVQPATGVSALARAPTEPPAPGRPAPPPAGALTFAPLWPVEAQAEVRAVEALVMQRAWGSAVRSGAAALAALLESLPGVTGSDGPMTKAALLGLDGREYLRLCRLASAPDAAISQADALFALHMLVAARLKVQHV